MSDSNRHNLRLLIKLSMIEGCCDITFRDKPPLLGVCISPELNAVLMYGAGAKKLMELSRRVTTMNGEFFDAADVWVIVPLPNGEPTSAELAAVDLSDGDVEVAPGVSLRKMAGEIYHCVDDASEEQALRRVLAA